MLLGQTNRNRSPVTNKAEEVTCTELKTKLANSKLGSLEQFLKKKH